jgi:hypothetical protein
VWIKNKYLSKYDNFQVIYSILIDAKLILKEERKILLADSINKISIDVFLINLLRYTGFSGHIQNYLELFDTFDNKIIYDPTIAENVQYSNIRNFLIEAGYMKYTHDSNIYYFLPGKYSRLKRILLESNSFINPKILKIIQEKQEVIGYNAELEIMNYEMKKLSNYPNLQKKLRHVAKYDSSAGYDIKSYNIDLPEKVNPKECFIEVKAISIGEMEFYWSRNEVEKAKKFSKKYCLYLLPIINEERFNIKKLKIISDPYANIFSSQKWNRRVENYSFRKQ